MGLRGIVFAAAIEAVVVAVTLGVAILARDAWGLGVGLAVGFVVAVALVGAALCVLPDGADRRRRDDCL